MKLAWVGLIDSNTLRVRPVASFGEGADDLGDIEVSADVESPFGHGPTGIAIRENKPFWSQDFLNDPATAPWHDRGARSGWAASAALPLHRNGIVIGAFILDSDKLNSFDQPARDLLEEMAGDISFALDSFAREAQRKLAKEEIERLAFYDPLTNLPNRRLLQDRLRYALAASARHHYHGAVLFIDLDDFKTLNDTKGHNIGDLLLIEVACRLKSCMRENDTVARVGGDEFVILIEELSEDALQAAALSEVVTDKILLAISQPYSLQGYEYHSSTSIGISLFHNQESTMDELLKRADTAMYHAKNAGRKTKRFYEPAMQAALETRTALESDLRRAITENQFLIYYQMQVNHSGQIIGAEALIRWQHPQRGLVSPLQFIPLAEETGMILPIGQWVLETACVQLEAWKAAPLMQNLQLAINVSASQFHQPDFVEQVRQMLHGHAFNPDRLKLELTESIMLESIDDTMVKMQTLRQDGVHFSMDDFGTGYSSLAYLTRLPFDLLKIDKSFVHNIGEKNSDAVIVQTIIGMANNLGMEVLAEGVETEEQRVFLEQHGCTLYQGYLFGKPTPIEEFEYRVKFMI
jgi:diguanylate cyclase (GGDEF)-like protein